MDLVLSLKGKGDCPKKIAFLSKRKSYRCEKIAPPLKRKGCRCVDLVLPLNRKGNCLKKIALPPKIKGYRRKEIVLSLNGKGCRCEAIGLSI